MAVWWQAAIARGLAYAPIADMLWVETSTPDMEEAREFATAIHAKFPGKLLAYNCSPSFNWKRKLSDPAIASFQKVPPASLAFLSLCGRTQRKAPDMGCAGHGLAALLCGRLHAVTKAGDLTMSCAPVAMEASCAVISTRIRLGHVCLVLVLERTMVIEGDCQLSSLQSYGSGNGAP